MAYRKATLRLGVISVGVGLDTALDDDGASLISICDHHGTPHATEPKSTIKRMDFCPVCKNKERDTFGKAAKNGSQLVMIDTTALQAVAVEESLKKNVTLEPKRRAQMTRALPSGKTYNLTPDKGSENYYALLAAALTADPEIAYVGEFSFGGPAHWFELIESDGVLMLRQLARPELVRARPVVAGQVNEQWLEMALQWARLMITDYDPAEHGDKRAAALRAAAETGTPIELIGAPNVIPVGEDLGSVLKAALAAAAAPPAPAAAAAPPAPVAAQSRRRAAKKVAEQKPAAAAAPRRRAAKKVAEQIAS